MCVRVYWLYSNFLCIIIIIITIVECSAIASIASMIELRIFLLNLSFAVD